MRRVPHPADREGPTLTATEPSTIGSLSHGEQSTPTPHCAKWSAPILTAIDLALAECDLGQEPILLDPFAGRGLDELRATHPTARWLGIELEPEWASQAPGTVVGDATRLPFRAGTLDGIVTSPCYGNRMADTYDGRDGSRRMTYRLALGRMPSPRSTATLQWGTAYRAMHRLAWHEAHRVIRPGGALLVNVSNHLRTRGSGANRQQAVQHVMEWHLDCLASLGFVTRRLVPIETRRMRQGANHDARVDAEHLLVMRRP